MTRVTRTVATVINLLSALFSIFSRFVPDDIYFHQNRNVAMQKINHDKVMQLHIMQTMTHFDEFFLYMDLLAPVQYKVFW